MVIRVNIHGLGAEIVNVVTEHLNHPSIIGQVGRSAVGEEWKSQCIDRQMPFNSIGGLVKAESLGFHTRIASILHGL